MSKGKINLTEARKFVISLMPPAGKILKKYFRIGVLTKTYKDEREFATKADLEVDQFLRFEIGRKYPQARLLTEETAPPDPQEMQRLFESLKDEDNLWVIDSLDGTWNFSRGHPNFAISVGLVSKGQTRLGVVYIPMTDEIYFAQEDKEGAFLNDQKIYVSKIDRIKEAVFEYDFPSDVEKRKKTWQRGGKVLDVMQIKTMSSAVADLTGLACGRIDAYLNDGSKPWDFAAAPFLVIKAGGKVTTPKGKSFNIFEPDIFASNGILHKEFLRRWKK